MRQAERIALQPAYVLHQRAYRESSLLVDLLTAGHGRVVLVARGARGRRSGLRALLQPFSPLLVSWTAYGELGSLRGAEPDGRALPLPRERLFSAWYLNELLLRLTERNDQHPALFADYAQALAGLASGSEERRVLRVFEKRLLDGLGYGLNLATEAQGRAAIEPAREYLYRLEVGAVRPDGGEGVRVAGASLLSLAGEELADERSLSDARRLLGAALELYLGERPLRTRQVLLAVRRRSAAGARPAGEEA